MFYLLLLFSCYLPLFKRIITKQFTVFQNKLTKVNWNFRYTEYSIYVSVHCRPATKWMQEQNLLNTHQPSIHHKLSDSDFPKFNNYQNEDRYLLILFFSLHASSYSVNSIILWILILTIWDKVNAEVTPAKCMSASKWA